MSYLLILVIFYQPIYWAGRLLYNRVTVHTDTTDYLSKIKSWFSAFWGLISPKKLNQE